MPEPIYRAFETRTKESDVYPTESTRDSAALLSLKVELRKSLENVCSKLER